jgi:UDP-N-acetylmuramoyl-L-alanine---L-glutamate ligase
MRPPISWSELAGRRVGIWGLGTEGRANLRACDVRGLDPVLVDDAAGPTDDPDLRGRPVLTTASGGLDALLSCDVVIKTPGISAYSPAALTLEQAGVQVLGGLGMWLAGADLGRVVCVTGTKGKSTTTSILGHLLRGLGYRTFIGGNLGTPPQDPAAPTDVDYWVIEVSSYQAYDVPVSPPVVCVTSLSEDHLPWHGNDPERYFADKLSLCTRPGARLTVANGDDPVIAAHAGLLGPRVDWVHDGDADWATSLGLLGRHNRLNALIARQALSALGIPFDDDSLRAAGGGFAGLPSRLHVVGEVGGVTFVDDGLSTNVLPVLAAVDSFPDRRVALLVGGQSRGISYDALGVGLRSRTHPLRLFPMPDNGADIAAAVAGVGAGDAVSIADVLPLADAVRAAHDWAQPDGVVLLSPAAPSFGRFRDYRDRGAAFEAVLHSLRP